MDGRKGWTVVAAGFVATVVVFGILGSFGALFGAFAGEFGAGRGATAALYSLTMVVQFTLGLVTGPAGDRHGPRPLFLIGAVVMSSGLLLTAMASSIWMAYLTWGVAVGVGAACVYIPMVSTIAGWFDRYRTLAMGLAVTGIGAGTLIVAPAGAWLVEHYGFRTTCLTFGAATAVVVPLCAIVVEPAPTRAQAAPVPFARLARAPGFGRLYATMLGGSFAVFVPFIFLAPFARDRGIGSVEAALLIGLVGGTSVVGRLGMAALGSRLDALRLYRGCNLAISLSLGLWLLSDGGYGWLAAFAVPFGVAYGGWISLMPTVAARLYGTAGLGRMLGLLYTSGAVGGLVAPPLAGALVDLTGGYSLALALSALMALGGWLGLGGLGTLWRAANELAELPVGDGSRRLGQQSAAAASRGLEQVA